MNWKVFLTTALIGLCLGVLLLIMLGCTSTTEAARPDPTEINSLTLTNGPIAYGETAEFDIHLGKHYQDPLIAMWCWQSGGQVVATGHGIFLHGRYQKTFDGSHSMGPITYNPWGDPTQPALCIFAVFDEMNSAKQDEKLLTKWIDVKIAPID